MSSDRLVIFCGDEFDSIDDGDNCGIIEYTTIDGLELDDRLVDLEFTLQVDRSGKLIVKAVKSSKGFKDGIYSKKHCCRFVKSRIVEELSSKTGPIQHLTMQCPKCNFYSATIAFQDDTNILESEVETTSITHQSVGSQLGFQYDDELDNSTQSRAGRAKEDNDGNIDLPAGPIDMMEADDVRNVTGEQDLVLTIEK